MLASPLANSSQSNNASEGSEKRRFRKLRRRDFLIQFCQGIGATLIPKTLWSFAPQLHTVDDQAFSAQNQFHLHPRYKTARPLDATLLKVDSGLDEFITEKYADQVSAILDEWRTNLLQSPRTFEAFATSMSAQFSGSRPQSPERRLVRTSPVLQIWQKKFPNEISLNKDGFLRELKAAFEDWTSIAIAEFQITAIEPTTSASGSLTGLNTRLRYEIIGSGHNFHRQQRVGNWDLTWESPSEGKFTLRSWRWLDETESETQSPIYVDITAAALGKNRSYSAQLQHGIDYWRTVLDGASGIDVYGHSGVSVADIDNDGFDDLYVCQPAGLPNRLYRNRRDGTFEDVTESSGLGVLENTMCALFADFNNDGRQDVIVVRASGPALFLNQGGGKFREQPDAFRFANPPQGTFVGAAVADYDRDGWLDIYFCLYSYYQGTGQYRYPLPYHDAENGPPNFLMRNNRDNTFRDVTAESGLNQNNTRYSFCCAWGDHDGDHWPDLYVVNDFGRKNLYRNNGNGTFTDIAPQAQAEDVGAGMSVSWFDHDNDGVEDLYVGNMWTAAGERVSTQPNFRKDSPAMVRALYQKHAMGNSLLRNQNGTFHDITSASGTGMGRWAWSSDAFDFDHDGFLDLYVTNGMVSGPSLRELNSFFWRQVVARSPDEAAASPEYEQGWNAINELIRSDGTWSGYERNVFYAHNGDGTFSDVSSVVGLDFREDGRAFALADLDHDGRLEIVLKNRNAPQLRVLKNVVRDLPPSISFGLQGTKSNHDAIGATVTIESGKGRQIRTVRAGSGFLSQHSKEIFFGLGDSKGPVQATIRWPSGLVQQMKDLPIDHRIRVLEGSEPQFEPFKVTAVGTVPASAQSSPLPEQLPPQVETWLLVPVSAPDFSLPDMVRKNRTLAEFRGKRILLSFLTTELANWRREFAALQKLQQSGTKNGLQVVFIHVGDDASWAALRSFVKDQATSFPALQASDDVTAIYNLLYRQLFDRHRDISLPTSFLIDAGGDIVKIYQGPIDAEHVAQDSQRIPQSDNERLARALPFPMAGQSLVPGRNYLSYGSLFFQRGYLEQAKVFFEQASREDPASAEALYGIGSVYLNQNKNTEAREIFEKAVKLTASYPGTLPDAWNNLGVIATREGRVEDSIQYFEEALKLSPRHVLSLDNLGNAYRLLKRWSDARTVLERALSIAPDDSEANYSLGMVYAQTQDTAKAYEYLQRALKTRPDYPEALNNLGVLYVMTDRREEARKTFEQCIRVAPAFDQAYLNLARIYALQGEREKARTILTDLLKQHPDHPQAKQMLQQLQ
jgi:tetratricopeptide (TPR) repeat protein